MKYFLIVLSIFLVGCKTQAEFTPTVDCETVFSIPEEKPEYPGGDEVWMAEVKSKIASLPCVSAKATHIRIIINADGEMTKPKLHPADVPQCESEITSQLKTFSRVEPAKQRGRPVCMTVVFPLREKNSPTR